MGILKREEEEALRREQEHRKNKDKGKHNSGHTHSHNQPKSKGSSGGHKMQVPLVKSVITSYKFLLLVAEDAIVSAAVTLVIWSVLSLADIAEVTIPTKFGVLWGLILGLMLIQTIVWKR